MRYRSSPSRLLKEAACCIPNSSITVIYRYGSRYIPDAVEPVDLGGIMELPSSEWGRHFVRECKRQDPASSEWVERYMDPKEARRLQYGD
jgi:hypothetical protein